MTLSTIFSSWKFSICKTFLELSRAILKSLTSPQCKDYGLSGNLRVWPEVGLDCVCSGPHNQEVNPEDRKLFCVLGEQFSLV